MIDELPFIVGEALRDSKHSGHGVNGYFLRTPSHFQSMCA